jgi:hypothetical protein
MCREITRRQTQKKMQILSTCYSQRACYCNKKNNFYADIYKTLVATDVPKNAIGIERSKDMFGKILQQYERMWMILVCISRMMILLMLVYVYRHTDDIGGDFISVSTQMVLVMLR